MVRFWSIFFCLKALLLVELHKRSWTPWALVQLHERSCNSTSSSRAFKQKKIDQNRTIIKEVISKLVVGTSSTAQAAQIGSIYICCVSESRQRIISGRVSSTMVARAALHESSWSCLSARGVARALVESCTSAHGDWWWFLPKFLGPWWWPTKVIYHSVNRDRVLILFAGGGDTWTQFCVIKLVWTFCTERWWGANNQIFWSCKSVVQINLYGEFFVSLLQCRKWIWGGDSMCKLVVQTGCANWWCKLYVQTGRANSMCKLVVQTLCANSMCKLVMQTAHANCLCKLLMQTAHAALHEHLWRAARALVESCMSSLHEQFARAVCT